MNLLFLNLTLSIKQRILAETVSQIRDSTYGWSWCLSDLGERSTKGSVASAATDRSGISYECETSAVDGEQDSWQCHKHSRERRTLVCAHKCQESLYMKKNEVKIWSGLKYLGAEYLSQPLVVDGRFDDDFLKIHCLSVSSGPVALSHNERCALLRRCDQDRGCKYPCSAPWSRRTRKSFC